MSYKRWFGALSFSAVVFFGFVVGNAFAAQPSRNDRVDAPQASLGLSAAATHRMRRAGMVSSYSVLYNFAGGPDAIQPLVGLTYAKGSLYGTTVQGEEITEE